MGKSDPEQTPARPDDKPYPKGQTTCPEEHRQGHMSVFVRVLGRRVHDPQSYKEGTFELGIEG